MIEGGAEVLGSWLVRRTLCLSSKQLSLPFLSVAHPGLLVGRLHDEGTRWLDPWTDTENTPPLSLEPQSRSCLLSVGVDHLVDVDPGGDVVVLTGVDILAGVRRRASLYSPQLEVGSTLVLS